MNHLVGRDLRRRSWYPNLPWGLRRYQECKDMVVKGNPDLFVCYPTLLELGRVPEVAVGIPPGLHKKS